MPRIIIPDVYNNLKELQNEEFRKNPLKTVENPKSIYYSVTM